MNLHDELVEIIKRFREYVDIGNSMLCAQYSQQTYPLLARRSGYIAKTGNIVTSDGNLYYNFHGNGVHLEFPNNRVVDFDYETVIMEDSQITHLPANFSMYSLHQFINSDVSSEFVLKNSTACEIAT